MARLHEVDERALQATVTTPAPSEFVSANETFFQVKPCAHVCVFRPEGHFARVLQRHIVMLTVLGLPNTKS